MLSLMNIAFDSSDLILFIDASRGGCQFSSHACVREAANATFRLFLYCRPFIVRTVMAETERVIENDAKLRAHRSSLLPMLAQCPPDDDQIWEIEKRAAELERFHAGQIHDCRILAEVEVCGVTVLVTFDTNLQKRLSPHTTVRIQTPVQCWQSLAILPGTEPKWSPAPGHPLTSEDWWRW